MSQLAICSSDGAENEADLISSQEATQNDYMADESGGDLGQGKKVKHQKSVYL